MNIYRHNGRSNLCGTRVKKERLRLKLTQEQLAAQWPGYYTTCCQPY